MRGSSKNNWDLVLADWWPKIVAECPFHSPSRQFHSEAVEIIPDWQHSAMVDLELVGNIRPSPFDVYPERREVEEAVQRQYY
jgi:hypothetical protein